jgi:hypothetical protein
VPFEDSDKLTEKAKALGVLTTYWQLVGLDHEFETLTLTWVFPIWKALRSREIEASDVESSGWRYMKELLPRLDEVVGK